MFSLFHLNSFGDEHLGTPILFLHGFGTNRDV